MLVVGGWVPWSGLSSAEIWDPQTTSFSPTGSLMEARMGHAATRLPDGRVLIVGGSGQDEFALRSAEIWDPASEPFSPAGSLSEGRVFHTATPLADGRVLVVGGTGNEQLDRPGTQTALGISLSSAEVWNPASGSFGPAGSLMEARAGHAASRLPDGRVLVVGGGDLVAGSLSFTDLLDLAEVWDPATSTSSPTGPLVAERFAHTATALPDGRVLVVGGVDESRYVASAEIWDPTMSSFGPAGSLVDARSDHTASALLDGRVLVVGGSAYGDPLDLAELWEPDER